MSKRGRDAGRLERRIAERIGPAVDTVNRFQTDNRRLIHDAIAGGLMRLEGEGDDVDVLWADDRAAAVFQPGWAAHQAYESWARHRVIYRADSTLLDELAVADTDTAFPSYVLHRLPHPEPCIVFNDPLSVAADVRVDYRGMIVVGARPSAGGELERCGVHDDALSGLGLLLFGDAEDGPRETLLVVPLDNEEVRLRDLVDLVADRWLATRAFDDVVRRQVEQVVSRVVPLLVYLCSVDPDVQPALPAELARHARAQTPARRASTNVWDVGWRVGAALKAWRERRQTHADGDVPRWSVRPHIRKAHPHQYWTGPRDGSERTLVLKFLLPIEVNMGTKDTQVPGTVHEIAAPTARAQ